MVIARLLIAACLIHSGIAAAAAEPGLPEWAGKIRKDHPRLFFNRDTWPAVRERALGPEKAWYESYKGRVDKLLKEIGTVKQPPARDLGPTAAWAAFVYLMTREQPYLDLAKKAMETSLRFYEQCFEERKAVNWYSTTRVHFVLAWDWLYNDLTEAERKEYLSRLVQVLQKVYTAKPAIFRENISGYTTGFYGVPNCKWFVGCAALGTGIEETLANEWLVWGYNENMRMLAHRKRACGDDGGSASPTLGYAFGAYPWAEQNFFYTWLSAAGENIAPEWPHSAWLANYVLWNWIETGGAPREFGWGDTPHTANTLHAYELYTHMANVRHLYGKVTPEAAGLARYLQEKVANKGYAGSWFIYPFLLAEAGQPPQAPPTLGGLGGGEAGYAFRPERLPAARHFESLGQIFMRSGTGAEDTYCLFTAGGILAQHRHYDNLGFIIYHRGHLALDSGTRYDELVNADHLASYYAQTVAHNCVLVHQPGEPPARYWGAKVETNHGGQHKQLGSEVKAFETNDRYVYVAGDATASYQHGPVKREGQPDLPEKVSQVTRQLIFLMPNHFVIFDRVAATDPSYRKEWLLHTAHEPAIEGKQLRADHEQGRLLCRTLLPDDAVLTPVGGPGREFWAAGRNWDIKRGNLKPEQLAMMGQWRVEVSPGTPRAEDHFLHVLQVGDQSLAAMDPVELLREGDAAGARVRVGETTWEVLFNTKGDLGGHIRCLGGAALDRPLARTITPQAGILALPE